MHRVARALLPARVWHRPLRLALVFFAFLITASCSRSSSVQSFLSEPFPKNLSAWHFFQGQPAKLQPNTRVIPYDLNTPLFSDNANKYRFVWMPPNTSATYKKDGVFDFPIGTVLIKTFAFPKENNPQQERLIETRLLVHTESGWQGLPYIWNDSQTEAHLELVPDPVPIRYTDADGKRHDFTYFIPNANECKQCHENNHATLPIGPKARNLNKDYAYATGTANQLTYWTKNRYLQGAPSPDQAPKLARWNDPNSGNLNSRARAYLDNNCAHCHQPGGTAGYTGVDLRYIAAVGVGAPFLPSFARSEDSASIATNGAGLRTFGICKSPNSAGRIGNLTYDLVPGHPDDSILLARMESTRPKEMMPQIGRSTVHEEGVALIREWIQSLPEDSGECTKRASRQ